MIITDDNDSHRTVFIFRYLLDLLGVVLKFLVVWLVVLRIYVAFAVFQAYRDLEAGDNQSLKFKWRGGELKFLGFILNIFKAFQILYTGLQISQTLKTFVSSSGHTRNFCSNLKRCRFKNMFQKKSLCLTRFITVIFSIYTLRRVKSTANFITVGSKIIKRLRPSDHREDNMFCDDHSTTMYGHFLEALHSD